MNRDKRQPHAQASKSHKQSGATRHADVAQMVECHLAKVKVAGSNPVIRSKPQRKQNKQTQAKNRGAHCE